MSVTLSWLVGSSTVEASFDAVLTETHSRSAQVTSHPVEKGADIADHVQVEPMRLTLEAVVTNTPTRTPATHNRNSQGAVYANDANANALQFDTAMDRPKDIYEDIRDAFDKKLSVTVSTALQRYESMVIVDLSVPREVSSGLDTQSGTRVDKLTFSIAMQQIRVVGSRVGEVRRPKEGTQKQKKQKGDKDKKEATDQDNRTAEARAWDSAFGRP